MNKLIKNIIIVIGMVLLTIVGIMNLITCSFITIDELLHCNVIKISYIIPTIIFVGIIYLAGIVLNKLKNKNKVEYIFLGIVIVAYMIIQIIWINHINYPYPIYDQKTTYDIAAGLAKGNVEGLIENGKTIGIKTSVYLERCPQQISTSFAFSILFRICNSTDIKIIEIFNAICNGITVLTIYLICKELSKKYKVNIYLAIILIATFMALPLLSTFIYGDVSGLTFSLLAIYLIMKYVNKNNIVYAIMSSLCMAVSYMIRTNMLIVMLAIMVYLFLDLTDKRNLEDKNKRIINILKKIIIMICFSMIAFMPSMIVQKNFCNKYNLDRSKSLPATEYLCMGMNEENKGYGWYNFNIANIGYKDVEGSKTIYIDMIKERLKYFIKHPIYTAKFYLRKTMEMWTENTYQSVYHSKLIALLNRIEQYLDVTDKYKLMELLVGTYQKAEVLIIFIGSVIVLWQKRKNLSNEILLLLTVFIGGFLFHTIWEAKSRYVIPYIIALIPIAAIEIDKIKITKNNKKTN